MRTAAFRLNLLIDPVDDTDLAVGPEDAVRRPVERLSARGGVGGILPDPFAGLTRAAGCCGRKDRALRVLQRMGRLRRFLGQRDVNLVARLFEGGNAARIAEQGRDRLAPIEARDRGQRTKPKRTLLRFFDCPHNAARTTAQPGIHLDTLRQRPETLRDIAGGWGDPLAAPELHVDLRLDEILPRWMAARRILPAPASAGMNPGPDFRNSISGSRRDSQASA